MDAEGNQRVWGTHHRRRDMEAMIWRFLTTFRAQDTAAEQGMATYTHLLRQVRAALAGGHACQAQHCCRCQQTPAAALDSSTRQQQGVAYVAGVCLRAYDLTTLVCM